MNSRPYISFSICFLMNSLVCAVTLSVLLQQIRTGIFFLTTLALVKISYRYLLHKSNIASKSFTVIRKWGGGGRKRLASVECALLWFILTLKLNGSLVRTPKHQQQTQCQLLEAKTHPVWAADENAQEHQQDGQAWFCPSVKNRYKKGCV